MSLADEKYLLLTTFRRDGTPVPTPVWVAALPDGKIGFTTSSDTGKVRRLAHTSRVTLQPCDSRGRPRGGAAVVEAIGEVVTGAALDEIETKVQAKYGIMNTMITVWTKANRVLKRKRSEATDCGVVITL